MKLKQIVFCSILIVAALLFGAALRHGSLYVVIAVIGAIAWVALVLGLFNLLLRHAPEKREQPEQDQHWGDAD